LNGQKDSRIKELEAEVLRMKQKLDKVLNKLYMPGQDQIIGGMSSNGFPHNVIRGAQQTVEMNHGVELEGAQGEGEGEDSPPRFENARAGSQMRE